MGGHRIDISVSNSSQERSSELIHNYLQEYPVMRPLVLVLKQLLYLAQLSDYYKGGFSSYMLLLLVVSYFQAKTLSRPIPQLTFPVLGIVFVDFFNFFSSAKFAKLEISPKVSSLPVDANPVRSRAPSSGPPYSPAPAEAGLRLIDPFNRENNLAQYNTKYLHLESLFYCVYVALHQRGADPLLARVFRTAKLFQRLNFEQKFK